MPFEPGVRILFPMWDISMLLLSNIMGLLDGRTPADGKLSVPRQKCDTHTHECLTERHGNVKTETKAQGKVCGMELTRFV